MDGWFIVILIANISPSLLPFSTFCALVIIRFLWELSFDDAGYSTVMIQRCSRKQKITAVTMWGHTRGRGEWQVTSCVSVHRMYCFELAAEGAQARYTNGMTSCANGITMATNWGYINSKAAIGKCANGEWFLCSKFNISLNLWQNLQYICPFYYKRKILSIHNSTIFSEMSSKNSNKYLFIWYQHCTLLKDTSNTDQDNLHYQQDEQGCDSESSAAMSLIWVFRITRVRLPFQLFSGFNRLL